MRLFSLRDLPFWTLHGVACAAPSFFIAFISGFSTFESTFAMTLGVIMLILFYTWLSSNKFFSIAKDGQPFSRSIRIAAHLRALYSCISFVAFFGMFQSKFIVITMLDVYTGYGALWITHFVLDPTNISFNPATNDFLQNDFLTTFLNTLITGILFSVIFIFFVVFVRFIFLVLSKLFRARSFS
jgi:hypothetical protein